MAERPRTAAKSSAGSGVRNCRDYGGAARGVVAVALGSRRNLRVGRNFVGTSEALEDSVAADIVPREQHGMAFGTLAAVNAIGDFLSSFVVGVLWSRVSAAAAFATCMVLFFGGATVILRLRK